MKCLRIRRSNNNEKDKEQRRTDTKTAGRGVI